jgi:hypothetical protein
LWARPEAQSPAGLKRKNARGFQTTGEFFLYRKSAERSIFGRVFILTVMLDGAVDDFTRECLALVADASLVLS